MVFGDIENIEKKIELQDKFRKLFKDLIDKTEKLNVELREKNSKIDIFSSVEAWVHSTWSFKEKFISSYNIRLVHQSSEEWDSKVTVSFSYHEYDETINVSHHIEGFGMPATKEYKLDNKKEAYKDFFEKIKEEFNKLEKL